jgi:hypothetical protein
MHTSAGDCKVNPRAKLSAKKSYLIIIVGPEALLRFNGAVLAPGSVLIHCIYILNHLLEGVRLGGTL